VSAAPASQSGAIGERSVFAGEVRALRASQPVGLTGRVDALRGLTVLARDLPAPVGAMVEIRGATPSRRVRAEVVGFDAGRAVLMLLDGAGGVQPGDPVLCVDQSRLVRVGSGLLGRVVDALGEPIDGRGALTGLDVAPLDPDPMLAMERPPIRSPLRTGVRAIDLFTPVGRGQRLGVFAGPGVGKSTLLGQIARETSADASVIALIGERGREVREFIEDTLGEDGLARSTVVVATSDEPPLRRLRAARMACAVAESMRDEGKDVLLVMDSVTRFAHAQRQVGLSIGEPPGSKGYTPSVFAELARLLERAGPRDGAGSITGVYTVLVEGDDLTEPLSDAARGLLDGHVVLSRALAQRGQFPAVDVLDSVSRVDRQVAGVEHLRARARLLRLLADYRDVEELVRIGAYAPGASPEHDAAIDFEPVIRGLLIQDVGEREPFEQAEDRLRKIASQALETAQRYRNERDARAATKAGAQNGAQSGAASGRGG